MTEHCEVGKLNISEISSLSLLSQFSSSYEAIQARAHDGSHTSNRRMNVLISGRRIHRMVACAPKESNRIRKGRGA